MTIEIGAQATFQGDALLEGLRRVNAALNQQTDQLGGLNNRLETTKKKTEDATKEQKSFLDSAVGLNAALEIGKKAFEAVGKVMGTTVDLLKSAAEHSKVLDAQFKSTEDRVEDLQKSFARAAEKSGALNGIFDSFQAALVGLTTWMQSPAGTSTVNAFFQTVATGAAAVALTLGATLHAWNELKKAWDEQTRGFSTVAITADGEEDTLEARLFNVYSMLSAAGGGGVLAQAPAPKAFRSRAPTNDTRDPALQGPRASADDLFAGAGMFGTADVYKMLDRERRLRDLLIEHREEGQRLLREADETWAADRDVMRQRELDADEAFYGALAVTAAAGIQSFVSAIILGLANGTASIEGVLGSFLGTILSGVGQAMIALGTAALAAATATQGIPLLWPIFGGPIGVAGAIGLITAGSVLAATGTVVGQLAAGAGGGGIQSDSGRSRGGGGGSSSRGRATGGSSRTGGMSDFVAGDEPATVVNNYNIELNGFVGDETAVGREIRRVVRRADRLGDARAGW